MEELEKSHEYAVASIARKKYMVRGLNDKKAGLECPYEEERNSVGVLTQKSWRAKCWYIGAMFS